MRVRKWYFRGVAKESDYSGTNIPSSRFLHPVFLSYCQSDWGKRKVVCRVTHEIPALSQSRVSLPLRTALDLAFLRRLMFHDLPHKGEVKLMRVLLCAAALSLCLAGQALAQVRITEWAYSGTEGEFVEFTNLGPGAVDFSGWSYDDDSRLPGEFDLSGFGSVAAGESVIITESVEADFRLAWSLPASVKVIGGYTNNLGRGDEINLFNGPDEIVNLVDRFAYGDQNFAGTIRTQNVSGNPVALSDLETDDVGSSNWVLAANGDIYGSYTSANGDLGNPGTFSVVPEPASLALVGMCLIGLAVRRR
jgi:hypothetical protein